MKVNVIGPMVIDYYKEKSKKHQTIGGCAIISSITMSIAFKHWNKKNIDVSVLGKVGNDLAGNSIISFLRKNDIKTDFIKITNNHKTKTNHLTLTSDKKWTFKNISKVTEYLILPPNDIANFILISGLNSLVISDLKKVYKYCKTKTTKFFSLSKNGKGEYKNIKKILSENDVIFCNLNEASQLFNIEIKNTSHLITIIEKQQFKRIIVTMNKNGVLIRWDNQIYSYCSDKIITVRNTIGAGDCFCGAFIGSWISTEDISKSLTFASEFTNFVIQNENWIQGIEQWNIQSI